jgi:antitoxin FitA
MVQVRNVPDAVHRKLKARAAEQGVSLSDYILTEMKRIAEQPTLQEIAARSLALAREAGPEDFPNIAELIREDREQREDHLANLWKANRAGEKRGPRSR